MAAYIPKVGSLESLVTEIFMELKELSKDGLVEAVLQRNASYSRNGILRCLSRLTAKGCFTHHKARGEPIVYKIMEGFEQGVQKHLIAEAEPIVVATKTYRKPFRELKSSLIPSPLGSREGSNEFRKIKSKFNE